MKIPIQHIIITLVIIIMQLFIISCGKREKIIEIKVDNKIDTIFIPLKGVEYEKIIDSLYNENNNLLTNIDSLNTEIYIYKFKLERIRYYNDIAKNGNNIKFLRGWINRVLEE